MNPARRSRPIRRVAWVLTGLAALLAPVMIGPAAFASPLRADPPGWLQRLPVPVHLPPPPPGWNKHPPVPRPAHVRAPLADGMPGWQSTLIAVAAAAAVLALFPGRAWAARTPRRTPARTQPDAR
jgi:hypothetical protein